MSFAALTAPGVDDDSFAALNQSYRTLGAQCSAFLSVARERGWVRNDVDLQVAGQAMVSSMFATTLPILLGNPTEFDIERAVAVCSAYLLGGLRGVLPDA